MADVVFYTQNSKLFSASISASTGTSSSNFPVSNLLNTRRLSLAKPGTISGGSWAFDIDLGSGVTDVFNKFILVNNSLYTNDATHNVTMEVIADDNSGFASPDTALAAFTVPSTAEPIWFKVAGVLLGTPYRYWRFTFANLDDTDYYIGCLFLLSSDSSNEHAPTVSPNLGAPMLIDRRGIITNENRAGTISAFKTQRKRRVWLFRYETISATDRDTLVDFEDAIDGHRVPFVWTDGTSYFYGRLARDSFSVEPVAGGLWGSTEGLYNVSFQVIEEA